MLIARDTSEKLVEGTVSAIPDPQGGVGGHVIQFRDVTDRIRAENALRRCEAQLRRGERFESLDRVTNGLAHDFGNWLTAVLVNISAAMTDLTENHPSRARLLKAERLALRAGEMVNQLVRFSRRKKRQLRAVDLNKIVSDVVEVLCCLVDTRIAIHFTPEEEIWPVFGDAGVLKELIFSLCLSARERMPGRGELMLQTENIEREEIARPEAVPQRHEQFVCLRVCDTGDKAHASVSRNGSGAILGSPEETGTGWSLTLVSAIIEQHGGWIDYRSEPDQGTRFEIYLPRQGSLDLQ